MFNIVSEQSTYNPSFWNPSDSQGGYVHALQLPISDIHTVVVIIGIIVVLVNLALAG